jgi:hypothetical protein
LSWALIHAETESIFSEKSFAFAANMEISGVIYFIKFSNHHIYYFDLNNKNQVDTGVAFTETARIDDVGISNGTDYFCHEWVSTDVRNFIRVFKDETWQKETIASNTGVPTSGVCNVAENMAVMGKNSVGIYRCVLSPPGSNFVLVQTLDGWINNFIYDAVNEKVYCLQQKNERVLNIYSVVGATATNIGGVLMPPNERLPVFVDGNFNFAYDTIKDRWLFVLKESQLLTQFASLISMYVSIDINLRDDSVFDAIKYLCLGFNLWARIGANKTGSVMRRIDNAGLILTTGNNVTLDADKARDISEESGCTEAYDIVEVSNDIDSETYDGTNFGVKAFGNQKVITINSKYIDSQLLKDYAFWFYKYFSVAHKRFVIPTPLIPFFQFEPSDGAVLSFTDKIITSDSGIIEGQSIARNGETEFEVAV